MTYATDMLRDEVQALATRAINRRATDEDFSRRQDLLEFFQEHLDHLPCEIEGCKDNAEEYIEFNDDEGINLCYSHAMTWNYGRGRREFTDYTDGVTDADAIHARIITLYDVAEGSDTPYGKVLGYYTGERMTHWCATLDYPRWSDIYPEPDDEEVDRFGRVRFWRLKDQGTDEFSCQWELVRWEHLVDILPMLETTKGDFTGSSTRLGLHTPVDNSPLNAWHNVQLVPGVDYDEACCPLCGSTEDHQHDWARELWGDDDDEGA